MENEDLIKILKKYKIPHNPNASISQLMGYLDDFESRAINAVQMIQRQLGKFNGTHPLLKTINQLSIYHPIVIFTKMKGITQPIEWGDLSNERADVIKIIAKDYGITYTRKIQTINHINQYLQFSTDEAQSWFKTNVKLVCRYCDYAGYPQSVIFEMKQAYYTNEQIDKRIKMLQQRTEDYEALIKSMQDKIDMLLYLKPQQPTSSTSLNVLMDDGYIYCIRNQNQCKIGKSSYKTESQLITKLTRRYGTPFGFKKLDNTNFKCRYFENITEAEKNIHKRYELCREAINREVFNIDIKQVEL